MQNCSQSTSPFSLTTSFQYQNQVAKGQQGLKGGGMALESCFQMSTITSPATTRATVVHARHPFTHKEKLNLSAVNQGSRGSVHSIASSSPSSLSWVGRRSNRGIRFVCEANNAVEEVAIVNDGSWNNLVIESPIPVLVDFWAPWCGPCRMIEPVILELANEYNGKISCYKVNTDECPNIASKYGIRSIPTVLLFKNGEKKESVIGAVPKSTLCATIDKYVET